MVNRSINPNFKLTDTESKICSLLNDYTAKYNASVTPEKSLVLRITGGWVRDKLLGDESNDLDISINHISGEEFASQLNEYILAHPEYGISPRSVHKIEKNPEKSKHLETCTTKLYGLDIDFVNLRSETYTSASRIPVITYGTPEEDALRRDATLNALFYNIEKGEVEDFTKNGLDDLQKGVLRTPLEPLQTFLDDPLRVLRLIRFASRFNFTIDTKTLDAMTNPELKSTLINKISRERVGVELSKTLLGPNPDYGLQLINYAGLYESVFNFGPLTQAIVDSNKGDMDSINQMAQSSSEQLKLSVLLLSSYLRKCFELFPDSSLVKEYQNIMNSDSKKHFWLMVILSCYGDKKVVTNPKKVMSSMLATDVIVREGIKLSKLDGDIVSRIVARTSGLFQVCESCEDPNFKRSDFGLFLKDYNGYWRTGVAFNCFYEVLRVVSGKLSNQITLKPSPLFQEEELPQLISVDELSSIIKPIFAKYDTLFNKVIAQDLQDVHLMKPLVDGKTLVKALQIKPGRWMSKVNEQIVIWQLDHPERGQEECIEHIKTILSQYLDT